MKTISLVAFISLCLLAGNVGAVEFPNASMTDSIAVQVMETHADTYLQKLWDTGVKTVRLDMKWENIDPDRDGILASNAFEPYDQLINRIPAGIRVYGYLYSAVGEDPSYYGTSGFRTAFQQFARDTVSHYSGRNYTWELWNEPNFTDAQGQVSMSADNYMFLANLVLPDIRVLDPTATIVAPTVIAPPLMTNTSTYLQDCYTFGSRYPGYHGLLDTVNGSPMCDGISLHFYRVNNPETVLSDHDNIVGNDYASLRTQLNSYGGTGVKIVSGEWGYPDEDNLWSSDVNISRQMQADYLARMMLTNMSYQDGSQQGIPISNYFVLSNFGNYGILDDAGNPKPAYYALKTLTTSLQDSTYVYRSNVSSTNTINNVVFTTPIGKLTYAGWSTGSVPTTYTDSEFGTMLLSGTPLYLGQQWTWQPDNNGSGSGFWSQSRWQGNWPWTNDGWQATFNTAHSWINVDNTAYTVSGLQLNADDITLAPLNGGKLNFTCGGGNIYVANNCWDAIACEITGGGDPSCFSLAKCGDGGLSLSGPNSFSGSVLIGQGYIVLGNNSALGNPNNPLILAGGGIDFHGYSVTSTGLFSIVAAGSTIGNWVSNTFSRYTFPTTSVINVISNFTVGGGASLELNGQLFTNGNTLTKNDSSTLTISGPGDNVGLTLSAHQGLTRLNKASDDPSLGTGHVDTHAVAWIGSIDSGATVQYAGSGYYQVWSGGTITLNGGTLDFNSHGQGGTTMTVLSSSTIANTGTTGSSSYSPTSITLQNSSNLTLDSGVCGLDVSGQITGSGSVTKSGAGLLTLSNSSSTNRNNYNGNTTVSAGNLKFTSVYAIPTTGKTLINNGGAVLVSGAYSTVTDWLNNTKGRLNTNSSGALALTTATSSETINMGSYSSLSLGASTNCTYSGSITPANNTYRFGGGGGTLTVTSSIPANAARSMVINGNVTLNPSSQYSYTGATTVNSGNLTFSSTRAISNNTNYAKTTINSGGAVCASGAYTTVTDWLNSSRGKLNTSSTGTLALANGVNTETISMGSYPSLSLGASGLATYNGTLTPANNTYRFGGGGGTLTVSSTLSGPNSLVVGGKVILSGTTQTYTGATSFDANRSGSTLTITNGASITNSSGITLGAGALYQNSSTALARPITFTNSNGTLRGTGQYNTMLNMQTSGGHLSPGASGLGSIGTMHLGSAADLLMGSSTTLDIDIASPDSYDTIAWDGGSRTLALAGTLNIFNDSGNATIPDGAYTLISGFSTYSGLSNLNFGAVPVGHIFSLAVTPVGNRFNLVLTAAPEPGTVVLLATGLLSLLAYTWKKRK